MNKRLNIKWVSEVINDDYKNWKKGDSVIIKSQTGTGKTYFFTGDEKTEGLVDKIKKNEKILYLCNRVNLKRQFKRDLLKKYGMGIPEDINELDKISEIGNITILSYQALAERELDRIYYNIEYSLDPYSYIIADEIHFVMADGSFNGKCDLVFNKLIGEHYKNSIIIFITATAEEVCAPILKGIEDNKKKQPNIQIHRYSTGKDYSYLDTRYFKEIDDIIRLIKNDKSDEKWLIFINSKKRAKQIVEGLKDTHEAEIIMSGTKNAELDCIIENNKFNNKVLVCTKAMDNGINIKDELVKNIVVMAWDKTTFIQEVGRVRVDIKNAQKINLYIPTYSIKSFSTKIEKVYKPKKDIIDMYLSNKDDFCRQFDREIHKLPENLFYISNGRWKLNTIGYARLSKDYEFALKMVQSFKDYGEFAYIYEQLNWLNMYFDPTKLIRDVVDSREHEDMQEYIEKIRGKKLFDNEQIKLTEFILKKLPQTCKKVKINNKVSKVKAGTIDKIFAEGLNMKYRVVDQNKEGSGEMRGKRYIIID